MFRLHRFSRLQLRLQLRTPVIEFQLRLRLFHPCNRLDYDYNYDYIDLQNGKKCYCQLSHLHLISVGYASSLQAGLQQLYPCVFDNPKSHLVTYNAIN